MDKNDQRKLTKVLENFDLREGGEGGVGLHVDNTMTMQLVTMQLDRLLSCPSIMLNFQTH